MHNDRLDIKMKISILACIVISSTLCSPLNSPAYNVNIRRNEDTGTLRSPLYPHKYPSNFKCVWLIEKKRKKMQRLK
ncbi:hypothetical protein QZH41_019745 [Actinostola sp. cb2023]|nr:hypothetical protein QZH41_019745 [Actinostola sp. cb2023]